MYAILLSCAGCNQRRGEAIVLSKEHIPVAEVVPSPSPLPSVPATVDDEFQPGHTPTEETEIVTEEESDRRRVDVQVEPGRWANLKEGDRVKVRCHVGKYTGTVWSSELK